MFVVPLHRGLWPAPVLRRGGGGVRLDGAEARDGIILFRLLLVFLVAGQAPMAWIWNPMRDLPLPPTTTVPLNQAPRGKCCIDKVKQLLLTGSFISFSRIARKLCAILLDRIRGHRCTSKPHLPIAGPATIPLLNISSSVLIFAALN
ncbi:hypothetical protein U9M48_041339 [Paspalum notatum var. saurae]|uniref:Uncharacterized protein n=1 Tax=Paspalum notatum var. saurae TaxID=547442 RepID=A0AAQ3UQ55_PASNO